MSVRSDEALSGEIVLRTERACAGLSVQETIRRYHDSLIRFLRQRLRVKEDAADIAQEAYIRMMQYEGSEKIQSPSSMLFRIAINVANDLGRSEQARRVSDQLSIDGMELASHEPSADREIAARQDLDILYGTIEQLPPKCRQPRRTHDLSADRRALWHFGQDGREAHQPRTRNLHEKGRGERGPFVLARMWGSSDVPASLSIQGT
jgi:RNA polymerase sigma factor (sigma-70 family)